MTSPRKKISQFYFLFIFHSTSLIVSMNGVLQVFVLKCRGILVCCPCHFELKTKENVDDLSASRLQAVLWQWFAHGEFK